MGYDSVSLSPLRYLKSTVAKPCCTTGSSLVVQQYHPVGDGRSIWLVVLFVMRAPKFFERDRHLA
jgi:hypothetical protein